MYERLTHTPIEWVVETGHDNCGAAWNAGARRATGEYLHFTADDLEPDSDDWLTPALAATAAGCVPVGWVHEDAAGRFGRDFPRVPFCRREWWQNIPEVHYFSDNAVGDLMARRGIVPMVVDGYDFYHRRSMVGRDESPERLERDRRVYEQAIRPSGFHQLSRQG